MISNPRKRRRPKMKLTPSQEKEWKRYQRDAAALGVGKKRKRSHQGATVNAELPLPSLPAYIRPSENLDDKPDLRCMICGAWYRDHRAGTFFAATFEDGVELIRNTAALAGEDDPYYSRGPVLWAMRVIKTTDFKYLHESSHAGVDRKRDWRTLLPWEHVGKPGKLRDSDDAQYNQVDDSIWQVYDGMVLTWMPEYSAWLDNKDNAYDCSVVDDGAACTLGEITRQAIEDGELEDIPF